MRRRRQSSYIAASPHVHTTCLRVQVSTGINDASLYESWNAPASLNLNIVVSSLSVEWNRISTCQMNRFATSTASMYAPLLTWRSMSEMHAADDSSKVDSTLHILKTFSSILSSTSLISPRVSASAMSDRGGASVGDPSRTFQNL